MGVGGIPIHPSHPHEDIDGLIGPIIQKIVQAPEIFGTVGTAALFARLFPPGGPPARGGGHRQ